jgi:hypothetical protein
VAAANLGRYDGSTGVLVDTNIWVDCIDSKSCWHEWAIEQLQVCSESAPLHVNLIIYTEVLVPGPNVSALDELLDVYDTQRSQLPWACAAWRRRRLISTDAKAEPDCAHFPIFLLVHTPLWQT